MKFGAVLRDSAAELPDTEDLFLKYKQLKKSLRRMQSSAPHGTGRSALVCYSGDEDDQRHTSASETSASEREPNAKRAKHEASPNPADTQHGEDRGADPDAKDGAPILLDPELEAEFLRVITADVMELNDRYIENEEDNVIKFGQLEDAAESAMTHDAKVAAYKSFVNLHGELLMLFHWSVLAYTGLVKILKKHRKRTGAPLHAPHLENLLSQPFCSVEVTCDMVRKAEEWVGKLAKELNILPPPPVPLPGDLLKVSGGGDGSETLTSPHNKALVLEAVAAAVEAAEAAEVENAVAARGILHREEKVGGRVSGEELQFEGDAAAALSGGPGAGDNRATRRIRAALNVWQQLHANVSTPSTLIAGRSPQGGASALAPGLITHPSNLTNSSVA